MNMYVCSVILVGLLLSLVGMFWFLDWVFWKFGGGF